MTRSAVWVVICVCAMSAACALAAESGPASQPAGAQAWLDKPDVVVAADGSGDFKTVGEAIASLDPSATFRVVILIRDGVYKEHLAIRRRASRCGARAARERSCNTPWPTGTG